MTSMAYDYRSLDSEAGEFRLLTILPTIYSQQASASQWAETTDSAARVLTPTDDGDPARKMKATLHELNEWIEMSTLKVTVIASSQSPVSDIRNHEWDGAVAKLLEMGYSEEKAQQALAQNKSGTDISSALEWLAIDQDWQVRRRQCLESRDAIAAAKSLERQASESGAAAYSGLGKAGRPSDLPVECILEKVSFHQPGLEYMALSYTWGDPFPTSSILINGKAVEVRENLEVALRHIRQPSQPVCIWIDAICINQSDDQEKSKQVLRMQDIYQHASSVVVWLGTAAEDSDKAMDAINSIGIVSLAAGILTLSAKDYRNFHNKEENIRLAYMENVLNSIARKLEDSIPYSAIMQLSLRPYFRRIWIIQEVALGREVTFVCGSRRVAFSHFAAAATFLTGYSLQKAAEISMALASLDLADLGDPVKGPAMFAKCKALEAQAAECAVIKSPDSGAAVLFQTRHRSQAALGSSPETLFGLLSREVVGNERGPRQRVTELKDIIYGLLGLASDREKLGIQPDYSESKSVEETFTEATRRMVEHGHLSVLAWCQHPRKLQTLPSWVPDFSSSIREPCGEVRRERLFNVSGVNEGTEWSAIGLLATLDQGTDLLRLSCAKVCTIERIAPTAWNIDPEEEFDFAAADKYFSMISMYCDLARVSFMSSLLKDWDSKDSLDMEENHAHQKVMKEARWRIPTGDLESGTERTRATSRSQIGYDELREYINGHIASKLRGAGPAARIYMLAMKKMHGRKPFCSADGFVGLVPAHAQLGDVVAIVDGADIPFVFRSHSEKGQDQYWQLIGEAYVHTIMDGEYASKVVQRDIFNIR